MCFKALKACFHLLILPVDANNDFKSKEIAYFDERGDEDVEVW